MKKINLSKRAKIIIGAVAGAVAAAGITVGAIFGVKAAKAKKAEEETTTDAE